MLEVDVVHVLIAFYTLSSDNQHMGGEVCVDKICKNWSVHSRSKFMKGYIVSYSLGQSLLFFLFVCFFVVFFFSFLVDPILFLFLK